MPFYELECLKCEYQYEIFSSMSKKDETIKKVKCPECNSKQKNQKISLTGVKFNNPVGTKKWNNTSTGHDYRFRWNYERPGGVREERQHAEKKSHMGPNPYPHIDDISSGEHFGEVK